MNSDSIDKIRAKVQATIAAIIAEKYPIELPEKVIADISVRAARRVGADLVLKTDLVQQGDPNA